MATHIEDIKTPWGVGTPITGQPGRLAWVDVKVDRLPRLNNGAADPDPGARRSTTWRDTNDPPGGSPFPTWSHDGTSIVYSSTRDPSPGIDERLRLRRTGASTRGATDLYEIPYANRAGRGSGSRFGGASTSDPRGVHAFVLPDDRLIASHRRAGGAGDVRQPERRALRGLGHGEHRQVRPSRVPTRPSSLLRKAKPGRQQPLAEVGAGCDLGQTDKYVLLAHLLLRTVTACSR